MNNYLTAISLNEFNQVLELHDIYVDKHTQIKILRALRSNIYALVNDDYTCVLEEYISHLADCNIDSICSMTFLIDIQTEVSSKISTTLP